MSVTFSFIGDEKCSENHPCYDCEGRGNGAVNPGCYYCKGTGVETETWLKHEVNLSNMNAGAMMRAMGFAYDCVGQIASDRLEVATMRVVQSALDDYTHRTALRLNQLAAAAMRKGVQFVTWG